MREISSIIQGGSEWDIRDRVSRTLSDAALNRIINGDNLVAKFAAEITGFSSVWEWIQNRIRTGNFEGINVGDFIQFTAGGNTIVSEVAGINTYTRYGSPEVPNHIDFISRDCWPDTIQWNLANFNNGTTVSTSPWLASNVYAWLNSLAMQVPNSAAATPGMTNVNYTTTGVLDKLPAALRAVIVQKRVMLPIRFSAGNLLTDDNSWSWLDAGLLWLPSETEVYGTTVWSGVTPPNQGWNSCGFVHYPIFATNMKRVKGAGDGGPRAAWWLCSVRGGDSTGACRVGSSGDASHWGAGNANRGPICFRIA